MIEGIGAVVSIQDYTQVSGVGNQISTQEASIADTSVSKSEGITPDTRDEQQEFNKDQVQQAVNKMNRTMETYSTELRFQLHEKSGEYIVKLINTKDNLVIREIPPERVLNMVAYFKEMLGLVVDKFA
ncbi:flagellar protein FlaG [Desulforamulus profundi]|uniref:Flagellar protein FlaG n=1 Tax=Desulforamulus profundi TaxID=1383067 RepID=A0A2C6MH36_9FIRM|nr:flagellar protein FlaG [Desulforamulus profundi]MCL5780239.1 flagellar protein FlaG [Bacillota bacterium]PHJ39062.1 flagellar protein FlaG [Desulforamulus profundi]